jgi:ribosome biogenesis GTPase
VNREGIVLSRAGGVYRVFSDGELLAASLRGRVKQHSADKVLVGDRVSLLVHPDRSATVEGVLPRDSLLRRRSPGKRMAVRAVAANLDQVVIVGSARRPDWEPALIDRFIVVAEANALPVAVVMNKLDLAPDAIALLAPYRQAGYETVATSAAEGRGLDELRERLTGRVSLFTGPTGVGKSSLLNAIQPGLGLRTGEVSVRAGSGRHTTVSAEMHPFSPGGFVVDTPGLRDIGLWAVEPADVAGAFPEIARFSGRCRFDNCRHQEEPGCAVREAADRGDIPATRLESYRRLLSEALDAARERR